mgnify:CR=1 FL=1
MFPTVIVPRRKPLMVLARRIAAPQRRGPALNGRSLAVVGAACGGFQEGSYRPFICRRRAFLNVAKSRMCGVDRGLLPVNLGSWTVFSQVVGLDAS